MIIGSREWVEREERERRLQGRPFDPVKAYRAAIIFETTSHRPPLWRHKWFWDDGLYAGPLSDETYPSSLHPDFVDYLDHRLKLYEWHEKVLLLKHQDLNWWQDRFNDLHT
jgi:hypothetical protein